MLRVLVIVVVVLLVSDLWAQPDKGKLQNLFDAPAKLSARSIAKGVDSGSYAFTPDGAWIVYASKTEGMVAIKPDGTGKRVLWSSKGSWVGPRAIQVSAKHVVFASADHEQMPSGHVYAAAIDGSTKPVQLSVEENDYNVMRISPDGAWVAFETMRGASYLTPIGGGKPRSLVDLPPGSGTLIYELLPGNKLVYSGGPRLQIRDLPDGKPRDLAPNVTGGVISGVVDDGVVLYTDKDTYIVPLDGKPAIKVGPPYRAPPHAIGGGRGLVISTNDNTMYVDAKTRAVRKLHRALVKPETVFFNDATREVAYYSVANTLEFPGRRYELRVTSLDGAPSDRAYAKIHAADVDVRPAGAKRVIVHARTDDQKMAVFVVATDTGKATRLTPLWPESFGDAVASAKHAVLDSNGELFVIDLP